ncbi:hypothetical protein BKA62DRAFT_711028, partial [Auriculariales sp. MPI-PUGE-AT-0066]
MSHAQNPSEQLSFVVAAYKEYVANDLDSYFARFAEDFRREFLPSTLHAPGGPKLGEDSKSEFMVNMKASREFVFTEDFTVEVEDVVEQPGRLVLYSKNRSTTKIPTYPLFEQDVVHFWDFRSGADGKLQIVRLKEFADSATVALFGQAVKDLRRGTPAA